MVSIRVSLAIRHTFQIKLVSPAVPDSSDYNPGSPGMEQNIPRLGQDLSGTMKRPGMNSLTIKYVHVDYTFFFQKSAVKFICNINK